MEIAEFILFLSGRVYSDFQNLYNSAMIVKTRYAIEDSKSN